MSFLLTFVVTGVIFAVIDAVWLRLMRNVYQREFRGLLRQRPNLTAAIVFYVLYIFGVVIFVVLPALATTVWQAGIMGALFGLVTYATYDLTNLATLKQWSVKMTVIDMIWGAFLTATSALATVCVFSSWAVV